MWWCFQAIENNARVAKGHCFLNDHGQPAISGNKLHEDFRCTSLFGAMLGALVEFSWLCLKLEQQR